MSDLNSVIVDIVSLLNNKYGTDISIEENIVTAYTPTIDDKKEEFTKEDIKWLLQQLKSHSFSGGVKGLVKRMEGKFNKNLIDTINYASRVHGDLEGVAKFLLNYDKLKDKLSRGKSLDTKPRSQAPALDLEDPNKVKLKGESIKSNIHKVKDYLKTVKEKYPKGYEGSFYNHTDRVLSKLLQYLNSSEKSKKLENDFIELFTTDDIDEAYGLLKGWKKLKVKGVTEAIEDIFTKIDNYFEKEEPKREKDILNPKPVDVESLSKLEKEVHILEKNRPTLDHPLYKKKEEEKLTDEEKAKKKEEDKKLTDEEKKKKDDSKKKDMTDTKEINKDIKKDKKKEINDVVKDVDAEDKFSYTQGKINEYLDISKKTLDNEYKSSSLHSYTEEVLDTLDKYIKGNDRDLKLNNTVKAIFNDYPGIIKLWEEINKPISRRLKKYLSSFNYLAKPSNVNDGKDVNKQLVSKLETLANKKVEINKNDDAIAKWNSSLTKKDKPKLIPPKVTPEEGEEAAKMYQHIIKYFVKHIEDLPKVPKKKDLTDIDLSEKEKKLLDNEQVMTFLSKVIHLVDDVLNECEEDEIDEEDVVKEVKKRIDFESKPKPYEKKDVLDRDIPKEQEQEKKTRGEEPPAKKKKESSTNIVNDYMGTIFYRLEKLASFSPDKLVKAEIESIAEDIKHLF